MRALFPVCVLLALACTGVGGSKDVADDSTPSEADADADADVDADPGPVDPIILSFSTNTSEIDPTDTVSFSVIVSDPQGIDDLIGGQLIDPGGSTYGTFSTASEEGAYSLSLGWSQVNTVRTIEFEAGSSENRTFRAQFYDAEGNSATDDLSVRLSCARSDEGACDGECISLSSDSDNCGACGNVCPRGSYGCAQGHCLVESTCATDVTSNCNQICARDGDVCIELGNQDVAFPAPLTTCGDGPTSYPRCDTPLVTIYPGARSGYCVCGDI